MPDSEALKRLLAQKEKFFLPFYREIVAEHPEGILSTEVKSLVAEQLVKAFGIDIHDPSLVGRNQSTNRTRADQWANNLTSNRVLDDYMLVAREPEQHRATLYPGTSDNSRPLLTPRARLNSAQLTALNDRDPSLFQASSGPVYRRSLQLADHVRGLSERSCAVARDECIAFEGRDGRPYVEAHHIVPMGIQRQTPVNLDRTTNMAPLCPGCHTCLHRGAMSFASARLDAVLEWFESAHQVSFQEANRGIGLDVTKDGLLAMYGADLPPD